MSEQNSVEWLFDKMADSANKFDNGEIDYTEYVNELKKHKEIALRIHEEETIAFVCDFVNEEWTIRPQHQDILKMKIDFHYGITFKNNNE